MNDPELEEALDNLKEVFKGTIVYRGIIKFLDFLNNLLFKNRKENE